MTRMLVRAASPDDALTATTGGVDRLEIVCGDAGAALDRTMIGAIRAAFPGILTLRADGLAPDFVEAAALLGADEIALPHPFVSAARLALSALSPSLLGKRSMAPMRLVAVIAAGEDVLTPLETVLGQADAVMLDGEDGGRLIDRVTMAQLDSFARACRLAEIAFGLAGGLEPPDVARLLVLQPDMLGFDAAVKRGHRADGALDPDALEAIRALIPREAQDEAPGDQAGPVETDRIFVHDFIVMLAIGAYQAERGVRQRVRFSVDADIRRPGELPHDMRGVFSYDIIIETIRVLAERPHVTFVETLAEELAASLLAYPQLLAVSIKVEKLDVIEGSVGIVVKRDRGNLLLKGPQS